VEIEDEADRSIKIGERERQGSYWVLTIVCQPEAGRA
jgi:hypothetical protein